MTMVEVRGVVQEALNRVRVQIFKEHGCDAQVPQALWIYHTRHGAHDTWIEIYLQRAEPQLRTSIDLDHVNSLDTHAR